MRDAREELKALIRVAVPVALGQTILATVASRFLVRHPAVAIDWRLIDEPGDLAAGGYDLWIRAGLVGRLGLVVRHLWRIDRTIVAAADPSRHAPEGVGVVAFGRAVYVCPR